MSKKSDTRNVNIHYELNSLDDAPEDNTQEQTPLLSNKSNAWLVLTKHRFFVPSIYVVLGCMFFLSVLIMFNTYVLHLKVETAVISSQIETMVSPLMATLLSFTLMRGSI